MTNTMPFVLYHKMRCQLGIFLPHKILDLFAQVSHDENKFVDTRLHQLIDDDGKDSLSS